MDIVEIIEVNDSLGFVLPEAVLARLKLSAGDDAQLTETPEGLLLTAESTTASTR